jgi:hypothetical protein
MRSRSASRLCSESTSWKISARRRYGRRAGRDRLMWGRGVGSWGRVGHAASPHRTSRNRLIASAKIAAMDRRCSPRRCAPRSTTPMFRRHARSRPSRTPGVRAARVRARRLSGRRGSAGFVDGALSAVSTPVRRRGRCGRGAHPTTSVPVGLAPRSTSSRSATARERSTSSSTASGEGAVRRRRPRRGLPASSAAATASFKATAVHHVPTNGGTASNCSRRTSTATRRRPRERTVGVLVSRPCMADRGGRAGARRGRALH